MVVAGVLGPHGARVVGLDVPGLVLHGEAQAVARGVLVRPAPRVVAGVAEIARDAVVVVGAARRGHPLARRLGRAVLGQRVLPELGLSLRAAEARVEARAIGVVGEEGIELRAEPRVQPVHAHASLTTSQLRLKKARTMRQVTRRPSSG